MKKVFSLAVLIIAFGTTLVGAEPGLKLFVSGLGIDNSLQNNNSSANYNNSTIAGCFAEPAISGRATTSYGNDSPAFLHSVGGTIENAIMSTPPAGGMGSSVPPPEPLPEPGTLMLLGMGIAGVGVFARRKMNP